MSEKRTTYGYIVSDSFHRIWLFRREQSARSFADSLTARARLNGSQNTYEVLQLPFSDAAARPEAVRV
jgi:hypothetical protein